MQYSRQCTQNKTYFEEESGSLAEYSGIAWFYENFHSLREFSFSETRSLSSKGAWNSLPRLLARSLVCFVLELASATLSISRYCLLKLKLVSFAFHRDLQLRSAEKTDVAISQIEKKKKEWNPKLRLACTHASFHETIFRGKKKPTSNRFYEDSAESQFSSLNEIFRRDKRKINSENFMLHIYEQRKIFVQTHIVCFDLHKLNITSTKITCLFD